MSSQSTDGVDNTTATTITTLNPTTITGRVWTTEWTTDNCTTNCTTEKPDTSRQDAFYIAYQATVATIIIFVMLSMGSGITRKTLVPHLRRPIGPIIGMVCQFLLMPMSMFWFAYLMNFDPYISVGIVITASCPGGVTSNIFSYWSRGDLTLSVCMTTISTLLSVLFMPLNVFIYTIPWADEVFIIPYLNIVVAIMATWVAVAIGLFIRWQFPRFAVYFVKVGSVIGFLLLLLAGYFQGQAFPEIYDLGLDIWLTALFMPFYGFILGFIIAACFFRWLEVKHMRTIGYETGMQNIGLALNMIAFSFPKEIGSLYSSFILLYGTFQIVDCTILSIAHQLYYRIKEHRTLCHLAYYKCTDRMRPEDDLDDRMPQDMDHDKVLGTDFNHTVPEGIEQGVYKNIAYDANALDDKDDGKQAMSSSSKSDGDFIDIKNVPNGTAAAANGTVPANSTGGSDMGNVYVK